MVGNPNHLPLSGMVVRALSQILAGHVCGMMLEDMEADVIKVEKPDGGDDNRRAGTPFIGGQGEGFMAANRNKRSLALNLRDESGRQVFERLLERADVLVENFRPGVMERLGIGYERLSKLKPSLIYCSISGHGGSGPYKDRG